MKKLLVILTATCSLFSNIKEKPFVIIIPSYNNELFCTANINSALDQRYKNYRVIFINDCSSDKTLELVKKTVAKSHKKDLVTIIDNNTRELALANYYYAIHKNTKDDEIIITLDGDDMLASPYVLKHLNLAYSNNEKEIWLTYGQMRYLSNPKSKSWIRDIPKEIVKENRFREYPHLPSHLRTFYSWLFKLIDIEDLQDNGEFYPMTWDVAMMLPMIEMARNHFVFIPHVLYIYNDVNTISDHRTDQELQFNLSKEIRAKPPYFPLPCRP